MHFEYTRGSGSGGEVNLVNPGEPYSWFTRSSTSIGAFSSFTDRAGNCGLFMPRGEQAGRCHETSLGSWAQDHCWILSLVSGK